MDARLKYKSKNYENPRTHKRKISVILGLENLLEHDTKSTRLQKKKIKHWALSNLKSICTV